MSGTEHTGPAEGSSGGDELAWAGLLAHAVGLVEAAWSLPAGAEGEAWRASAPALIELQAVVYALAGLESAAKTPGAYSVGVDRASLCVARSAAALERAWSGRGVPGSVREVIDDATRALAVVRGAGTQWTAIGLGTMPMLDGLAAVLRDRGFRGEVWALRAGSAVMPSLPIALARERDGSPVRGEVAEVIARALPGAVMTRAASPGVLARRGDGTVYRVGELARREGDESLFARVYDGGGAGL